MDRNNSLSKLKTAFSVRVLIRLLHSLPFQAFLNWQKQFLFCTNIHRLCNYYLIAPFRRSLFTTEVFTDALKIELGHLIQGYNTI